MTDLDPDQLLKSMDAQIAVARSRRSNSRGPDRNAVRVGGILALVIGAAVALCALQYMANDLASSHHALPAPAKQQAPSAAQK